MISPCRRRPSFGSGFARLGFLCALAFLAFKIPPPPHALVYDGAHLLSAEDTAKLEEALEAFERQSSNQLVVATFPSLEGEALEDLTIRIAEAWKPGQKTRDNGAILFVFKDDRAVRIEVGYGLEGYLTDAISHAIIAQEIVPHFKAGEFELGILAGVSAMIKATQGAYTPLPQTENASQGLPPGVILIGILVFIVFFRIIPWPFWFGLGLGGLGGGYRRHSDGGWGGGGFGGFGGGSFGGGGASGRW